jgi:hypothetical protein
MGETAGVQRGGDFALARVAVETVAKLGPAYNTFEAFRGVVQPGLVRTLSRGQTNFAGTDFGRASTFRSTRP